jgi:hypothetical protein
MRGAPDGDGDVYMAGGAVTSFLNASCTEADTGEPRRRSCSGKSSRTTTAVVVEAGGTSGGAWRAELGYKPRLARHRGGTDQESATGSGGMDCTVPGAPVPDSMYLGVRSTCT